MTWYRLISNFYTFDMLPWTGDRPPAMSVATKGNTEADKAQIHIDNSNVVRTHDSSVRTVDDRLVHRCDRQSDIAVLWRGVHSVVNKAGKVRVAQISGAFGFVLGVFRGEFRPRQTRQLPRAVDLKGRLLSCQSY